MLKSFKTEINPTEEQKTKIRKTIGTCRFIYNFYLAHNKKLHEDGKKFMSSNKFRIWLNNDLITNIFHNIRSIRGSRKHIQRL